MSTLTYQGSHWFWRLPSDVQGESDVAEAVLMSSRVLKTHIHIVHPGETGGQGCLATVDV